MNTHVEDEIEGCNYIFGNMSGDRTGSNEGVATTNKRSCKYA